jgi:hypothetical protein
MTVTRFHHVYEQVTQRVTKNLPCPSCGKKVRRSTTISNTVNPFNKNADGEIRTRAEVRACVLALAAEWQTRPEICRDCS